METSRANNQIRCERGSSAAIMYGGTIVCNYTFNINYLEIYASEFHRRCLEIKELSECKYQTGVRS